jgi:hypothetical protein
MPTGARPSITITPLPGDKPAWMIAISPAPPAGADLFADAPGDWFFDTRPASGGFRLELAQRPSDARDGKVDVTLTHTFANGAWEARISLDAGPPKP